MAQDPAKQRRLATEAARAAGVLGHRLATVVHTVVGLDRILARALGDVGHLGAIRQATT